MDLALLTYNGWWAIKTEPNQIKNWLALSLMLDLISLSIFELAKLHLPNTWQPSRLER